MAQSAAPAATYDPYAQPPPPLPFPQAYCAAVGQPQQQTGAPYYAVGAPPWQQRQDTAAGAREEAQAVPYAAYAPDPLAAATFSAALRMRSRSATEVPPNFITSLGMTLFGRRRTGRSGREPRVLLSFRPGR